MQQRTTNTPTHIQLVLPNIKYPQKHNMNKYMYIYICIAPMYDIFAVLGWIRIGDGMQNTIRFVEHNILMTFGGCP